MTDPMADPLSCRADHRRARVRRSGRNGVDAVEPADDGRTLTVTFLGRAPEGLTPANVRIDGGRRITGIRVLDVTVERADDPDLDDRMHVTVDRPGDTSTYTLRVVEAGPHGRPGTRPYPGFDPRYAAARFTFHPQCPAAEDCAAPPACPPEIEPPPVLDYTARDYAALRRLMLDRLALTLPGWTERHAPDLQLTLVELLAYAADRLAYQQDAVAAEAYLDTARRRISVRRHARLVDHRMHDGCNARAFVAVETDAAVTLAQGTFRFLAAVPPGPGAEAGPRLPAVLGEEDLAALPADAAVAVFEPLTTGDVTFRPEHNLIRFWTWGGAECHLPPGATRATLCDDGLCLAPGDLLILEEVRGPHTGAAADADPAHRQAVRLTSVTRCRDELYDRPVLEVTWAEEDALRFPLCLSGRGGPDCAPIEDVSVARGNVVLVDHGRTLTWCGAEPERLDAPPAPPGVPDCGPVPGCPGEDRPLRPAYPPLRTPWRPVLARSPVTRRAPYPDPRLVAAGQARLLDRIPDRARDRVAELWRAARHGRPPGPAELAELTALFGAATLREPRPADRPERALRELHARFDELLAAKLRRLRTLADRARAGTVLGADVVWEIGHTWGERYRAGLDPDDPRLAGPAAAVAVQDPREALPQVRLRDRDGEWTFRPDLLASGPRDRHVVGETDDEGRLVLRFGDGRAGLAPRPGARLTAAYRVGNGTAGNVGAEAIGHLVLRPGTARPPVRRVRNPLPAAGGTDPEPVAAVRRDAPRALRRTRLRAVTAADYAELAGRVPGVRRAAARLRWTGHGTEVHVAIDAAGGPPDAELLARVAAALEPYRRIGHDVVTGPARSVPLDVALEVCAADGYRRAQVRAALLAVLGAERTPEGGLGFFHPDALDFGAPVRAGRLVAAAMTVPGVVSARVTRLHRLFRPGPVAEELPIGPLEIAQCDNDPDRPEHGRLSITVRGGR